MEIPKHIPNPEQVKKFATSYSILRIAALCSVLAFSAFTMSACVKEQSRWTGEKYNLGKLPDDVCMVDGTPKVINANSESTGGISLVYIRKNGDVVLKRWDAPPVRFWELREIGEFYWTGDNCPSPH